MFGKKESVTATYMGGDLYMVGYYRPPIRFQNNLSAVGSTMTCTFVLDDNDSIQVRVNRDTAINFQKGVRGILTTRNGKFISFVPVT